MACNSHLQQGLMPKRIQRKRTKGWRKPEGAVNVTRPGKWGNPFRWDTFGERCLWLFRRRLGRKIKEGDLDLEELRGKDLVCWCKLGAPCHADILLEMANR